MSQGAILTVLFKFQEHNQLCACDINWVGLWLNTSAEMSTVSVCYRQLQKQRLRHVNAIVVRDSLRNEVSKQQHIEEEMREKREQQKMDIDKLNLLINQAEEQMVQLRKRYETAVQHRNDRSVHSRGHSLAFWWAHQKSILNF